MSMKSKYGRRRLQNQWDWNHLFQSHIKRCKLFFSKSLPVWKTNKAYIPKKEPFHYFHFLHLYCHDKYVNENESDMCLFWEKKVTYSDSGCKWMQVLTAASFTTSSPLMQYGPSQMWMCYTDLAFMWEQFYEQQLLLKPCKISFLEVKFYDPSLNEEWQYILQHK